MSKVKIEGNASGTGTLTISAPNTNTDRSLTLPDGAGEILTDASSLPAANLTGTLPAIDGSALTGVDNGWVLLSSVTASGQAYAEFNSSLITSDYEDYVLVGRGVTPSTTATNPRFSVSVDNGSTFNKSVIFTRTYQRLGAAETGQEYGSNSSGFADISQNLNSNTAGGSSFTCYFHGITVAAQNKYVETHLIGYNNSNNYYSWAGGAVIEANGSAINYLRFYYSSGNLNTGKINLYGVKS